MNLYLLTQDTNNDWDTFDSCVVVASSIEEARLITPDGSPFTDHWPSWALSPDDVTVTLIGSAEPTNKLVLCASFNAR